MLISATIGKRDSSQVYRDIPEIVVEMDDELAAGLFIDWAAGVEDIFEELEQAVEAKAIEQGIQLPDDWAIRAYGIVDENGKAIDPFDLDWPDDEDDDID